MFPLEKRVIAIDSTRGIDTPPEPPPAKSGRQRRFFSNQYTRRSWLLMFVSGAGVWKISRRHGIPPTVVEQELREHLIRSGVLQDSKKKAA